MSLILTVTRMACALCTGVTLLIVTLGVFLGGIILATEKKDSDCNHPDCVSSFRHLKVIGIVMLVGSLILCGIPGFFVLLYAFKERKYVSRETPCAMLTVSI